MDYIATLSESLNGAIKCIVPYHNQVALAKGFLEHSIRAYHECKMETEGLKGQKLMPLVYKYYEVDKEVSKSFTYRKEGDKFMVLFGDSHVATVFKTDGKFTCACNQLQDIGTVCPHILTVTDVDLISYTHEMWQIQTYLSAFQGDETITIEQGSTIESSRNTNQTNIIIAVQRHKTTYNETTRMILDLLGERE